MLINLRTNKSSGKKILNTTFYPDQKGINKLKRKISNYLANAKNMVATTKRLCDHLGYL